MWEFVLKATVQKNPLSALRRNQVTRNIKSKNRGVGVDEYLSEIGIKSRNNKIT